MCLAIPGKVIEIKKKQAVVKYPKETRTVFLSDVPVKVGDSVLVQMGIVVRVLSSEEAEVAKKAWV